MKTDVKALFISDVHLGSKGSNAEQVNRLLKQYSPQYLFLVGDLIDGWLLQKRHFWPQSHTNVVQRILKISKRGTQVIYLTGNHDEFLREYDSDDVDFGNIKITDEYIYEDYLVLHGDKYDGIVKLHWLGKIGAIGYELSITIDKFFKSLGFKWSFSKFAKEKVKEAVKFITNFEITISQQAKKQHCKGVICGHIHKPADKYINDIRYLNCGDWIENNSYIIHSYDGDFKLCFLNN